MAVDLRFWSGGVATNYQPGDGITAAWVIVGLLKWLAARRVEHAEATGWAQQPELGVYEGGILPIAFIAAVGVLLMVTLATPGDPDARVLTVGGLVVIVLIVARQELDLRESDRLRDRYEAAEARFRGLLEHAYDAMLFLDTTGRIRFASPAAERLLGAPLRRDAPWTLLPLVHRADRRQALRAWVAARHGPRQVTLRVTRPSGDHLTIDTRIQDRRRDALVGGWAVNGVDRTRQARLAQRLADAQPLEALGALAGGLAHDLNNILTVVASCVEFLEADAGLRASHATDLSALRTASDQAQALTQRLLALSRRKSVALECIDVGQALEDRVVTAGARGRRLDVRGGGASRVLADPQTLPLVLDAVLVDAGGSTTSRVQVSRRSLDAGAARPLRLEAGEYVVIATGDTLRTAPIEIAEPVELSTDADLGEAAKDLALLMGLASARELGGTIARESDGRFVRLAAYLPSGA